MNETSTSLFYEGLIRRGLERSCESLAFFLKNKVYLEHILMPGSLSESIEKNTDLVAEHEIVLCTQVMGEIKGSSYFLLNKADAELLVTKNFPGYQFDDPKNKIIIDAFLLELDNIITASVITEFSNSLKTKMFGSVPSLFSESDFTAVMKKNAEEMQIVDFNCLYKVQEVNFTAKFVWFLEGKFVQMANAMPVVN